VPAAQRTTACLISRFIDTEPEFVFVAPDEVIVKAKELDAIPYDVHGVELLGGQFANYPTEQTGLRDGRCNPLRYPSALTLLPCKLLAHVIFRFLS
jgi:hypothetical protein